REREQLAQVDAPLERRLGRLEGLERLAQAALGEQALEHRLDVVRAPEDPLELGAATSRPDDREVALARLAEALAVEEQRRSGLEVRLAHDELAAASQLDDGQRAVTTWRAAFSAASSGVEGSSAAGAAGALATPEM